MSLNNCAAILSNLERYAEGLAAFEEALQIRRQLAATRPNVFLVDVAVSLNNISASLTVLGRGQEALAASEEAVHILRQLAATRPDALLPDLAKALSGLGTCHVALANLKEAISAFLEGVRILSQFFLNQPIAHAHLMADLVTNYLRTTQSAGVTPDLELLSPIWEIFNQLNATQSASAGLQNPQPPKPESAASGNPPPAAS